MHIDDLDPGVLHSRRESGSSSLFLDVRTQPEYAEMHVTGAELMPLDALDSASVRTRAEVAP